MPSEIVDSLALLAAIGEATPTEIEKLCMLTMQKARVIAMLAVRNKNLRTSDVEDMVMLATERAWNRLKKWDIQKAGWLTYVAIISESVVGSFRRQYGKEKILESLEERDDLNGR